MTAVVKVENLVAGYLPGVNILNGTNLVAEQGELIGIIGPNGAGKSTLLKAIFGQVKVRDGSILLNGDDITGLRAHKLVERGVGFVPQNNNVFPSLSIEDNLKMGIYQRPRGVRRARRVRGQHLPGARQAAQAARGVPLGWRAPDGGDVASPR